MPLRRGLNPGDSISFSGVVHAQFLRMLCAQACRITASQTEEQRHINELSVEGEKRPVSFLVRN